MSDDSLFNTYRDKSYRFISFDGLYSTIENQRLRFSRADQFNDPLDNSPFLMNLDWESLSKKGYKLIQHATKIAFEKAFSSTYICCFSKTYTTEKSYLMWAHYGKSHTQVCFEIDFSKHDYCGSPSEVVYPENLLEKRNIRKMRGGELGMFVVTNKSNIWNYEEEVRLVFDIRHSKNLKDLKIANDGKNLDVPFDPKFISKVVFGYKSLEFDQLKTISFFNNIGHKPRYEQMVVDPLTLKLRPIPYEPLM